MKGLTLTQWRQEAIILRVISARDQMVVAPNGPVSLVGSLHTSSVIGHRVPGVNLHSSRSFGRSCKQKNNSSSWSSHSATVSRICSMHVPCAVRHWIHHRPSRPSSYQILCPQSTEVALRPLRHAFQIHVRVFQSAHAAFVPLDRRILRYIDSASVLF